MALVQLRRKIENAKIKGDEADFMPKGILSDILTYEGVVEALQNPEFNLPAHKRASTATDIIQEPALKIFAILVESKCEGCLVALLENNYSDNSLPVDTSVLDRIIPDGARSFVRLQQDYLVYSFRKGQFHRKLQDPQRLPYITQEDIGGGGHSRVYRALVHASHQDFVEASKEPVSVVRKQLRTSHENGKAEAELLYLLGSLRHRNIVEILTSYVQHGVSNLLFHPAELDLHDFLLKSKRPPAFKHNYELLRAMQGLASGVTYLHNFRYDLAQSEDESIVMFGYHHDIKPRNILIRGSDFILADFGFARLKPLQDDSKTRWKDTTFEYGPPECRDPQSFEPRLVGRPLDIWSLGCVYSELLAYAEGGSSNVTAFRSTRIETTEYGTTRCFHDGEKLSLNVSRFLDDITTNSTSRSFHQLSKLVRWALSANPVDRPKAEEIKSALFRYAIEDLIDELLALVATNDSDGVPFPSRNLFWIRLAIEKYRLLAWADSLGFRLIRSSKSSYHRQVDGLAAQFYEILESVLNGWAPNDMFPEPLQNESHNLQALRAANDRLCEHLHEETKVSIDETFQILAFGRVGTPKEPLLARLEPFKDQNSNLGAIAAMKYVSLLLEQQALIPSTSFRIESSLMREHPRSQSDKRSPNVWLYAYGHQVGEEKEVIVEFVQYWWQELETSGKADFERAVESMFERLDQLVQLLRQRPKPAGFLSLDCLGAFHDERNQRWGLVYDFPHAGSFPICLNSLLRHGRSCAMIPDLRQKFVLAKKLVTCIQSCHTAGWIHKNISSTKILFFNPDEDYKKIDLEEPYLIGFDYSRPSHQAYSQGLFDGREQEYLHPAYRKGGMRATMSYDYYSLGLVLLEIGTWTSISNVHEDRQNLTLTPMQLREKYIAWCERDLNKTMGPVYQDVTRTCLEFDSGESTLIERLDFQAEVVDKIKTINL